MPTQHLLAAPPGISIDLGKSRDARIRGVDLAIGAHKQGILNTPVARQIALRFTCLRRAIAPPRPGHPSIQVPTRDGSTDPEVYRARRQHCEDGASFRESQHSTAPTFWSGYAVLAHRRFPERRVVLGVLVRPFNRATMSNRRRWTRKDGRKGPESQRDGPGLANRSCRGERVPTPDAIPAQASPPVTRWVGGCFAGSSGNLAVRPPLSTQQAQRYHNGNNPVDTISVTC
jgi:hypothetical protein